MAKQVEAYYQRLFEDAPIGIYRSTPEGKIIDANKTLVDMLGFPNLQSLMEVNLSDLFVDPQKRLEEISLLEKSGMVNSFEIQFRRQDGDIICVRDTVRVIQGDDGSPSFHEGVLEDVTERVQAKKALFKSRSRVEAERAQRQLAETLREIANLITGSLEFDNVTQQVFDNLGRLLPFDSAGLILLHPDGDLRMVASCGIQNPEQVQSLRIRLEDDPLTRQIIETQQPLLLDNATDDPRFKNYGEVSSIKNWLGVPLIVREKAIGILALDSKSANVYQDREIELAFTLASQIATAIENARLFEAERQKANVMSALHATLADITAELDLSILLQSILERAITLLNSTGGELALYDESNNNIKIVACHNMGRDFTGRIMKPGQGAIGHAIISGQPLNIPDYKSWPGHLNIYGSHPWKAVIAIPLKVRGRTLGVIALADSNQERHFDHDDLRLITLFAHQAAIAIKNAQLFEEVQKLAETDELTKIHNRRQLFNIGEREFERSKRYNQPLSVIMLDIDNFKMINDTYGHAVGDIVLYSLAQNCLINIREIDSIGRYGGEEFVILLPHTHLELGCEIGERLQSNIGNKPIFTEVGALKITISMGIAERDESMPNLAALIDKADTALYKAKNGGRNRIETYQNRQGMKIAHFTK